MSVFICTQIFRAYAQFPLAQMSVCRISAERKFCAFGVAREHASSKREQRSIARVAAANKQKHLCVTKLLTTRKQTKIVMPKKKKLFLEIFTVDHISCTHIQNLFCSQLKRQTAVETTDKTARDKTRRQKWRRLRRCARARAGRHRAGGTSVQTAANKNIARGCKKKQLLLSGRAESTKNIVVSRLARQRR